MTSIKTEVASASGDSALGEFDAEGCVPSKPESTTSSVSEASSDTSEMQLDDAEDSGGVRCKTLFKKAASDSRRVSTSESDAVSDSEEKTSRIFGAGCSAVPPNLYSALPLNLGVSRSTAFPFPLLAPGFDEPESKISLSTSAFKPSASNSSVMREMIFFNLIRIETRGSARNRQVQQSVAHGFVLNGTLSPAFVIRQS